MCQLHLCISKFNLTFHLWFHCILSYNVCLQSVSTRVNRIITLHKTINIHVDILCIKCNALSILGNVTPNPSAVAAKVPGPETGVVPKQSATASAPVAPPFSNNSIYPNAFALPHHGPLQPVMASCFPNPLPMHFPATSVPNPVPQEFMRHPAVSKYCITDSLVKGYSESLALAFVYGWLQVCLKKYHLWLVASVP